jgi:anti-sigma regulatory factor (Ser/Thr protein kinase)
VFTAENLGSLRHSLAEWASGERLGAERIEELVLAVNELATNSVRHGGGGGTLRVWREAETLLCEIQDNGHIEQPLLGRTLPGPDARSGRGLWLANQLCDLVQIRSSPDGTVVRVHTRLA